MKSLKKFYEYLDVTEEEICNIVQNLESYYYQKYESKHSKRGKPLFKDGKPKLRELCPSTGKLKTIQQKINKLLKQDCTFPAYYFGGIKGKDNIKNAKYHQGNHYFFLTDFKDFYPSIKSGRVYDVLIKLGYSPDISHTIVKLCMRNDSLPQGIPTASLIANLCTIDLTNDLIEICKKHGLKFSVYIDDLTFSSQDDFSDITNEIIDRILVHGFKVNHNKTSFKIGRALVTGVVVRQNSITPASYTYEKYKNAKTLKERNKIEPYIKRIKPDIDITKLR